MRSYKNIISSKFKCIKKITRNFDIIFVLLASVAARIFVYVFSNNSRLYYPDSWDYVVLPSQPGPPRSFHPPTIWHVWNLLTFGNISESSVIRLQILLGIITTGLLYIILRKICLKLIAVFFIFLYIMTPWQYFFERTFLPESMSLFLVILIIWLLSADPTSKKISGNIVILAIPFLLGLLVALKPLFAFFGAISVIFITIRNVKYRQKKEKKFSIVILSLLGFASPIVLLCSVYFTNFGVFSISPGSGSFLITRWADFVSCEVSTRTEGELIAKAVREVCLGSPGEIPGDGNSLLWQGSSVGKTLDEINSFGENQKELTIITINSLLSNKLEFATMFMKDLLYPFTHFSEPNDLEAYVSREVWIQSGVVQQNFLNFSNWFNWFNDSREIADQNSGTEKFKKLISHSLFVTHFLMWMFVFFGLFKILQFRIRYRNLELIALARHFYFRFSFGLKIGVLYILLTELVINATSVRNFRYDLSQIPIWILMISIFFARPSITKDTDKTCDLK
jgi:hypothetical protein